jgi:Mg2+-importing ATPase
MAQLSSPKEGNTIAFWSLPVEQIYSIAKCSANGLSSGEATDRLKASLSTRRKLIGIPKYIRLFIEQFTSPLVLLLVAAIILSIVLGERSDAIIIFSILFATGVLSFIQEYNAGRTVEKLQQLLAVKVNVLRDGKIITIPAEEVVQGDVLQLQAGDIVTADCLLLESNELHANEASLTGESFPVRKNTGVVDKDTALSKRLNCLWQGSSVVSGTAKALVVNTGIDTVFGGVTKSASEVTETTFEKGIRHFGYFLMQITLVLAIVILVVNILFGRPVVDSLMFALALAVGMAPELLPAINTIAMSAGAKKMLQKKVIVKKLAAIQNLGEVNLLCTDKTGTITEGNIRIAVTPDLSGKDDECVKELAFTNAYYESGYVNPIDEALRNLKLSLPAASAKVGEIPYDFLRKRLTIAVKQNGATMLTTKGAVNVILTICNNIRINDKVIEPITPHLQAIQQQYEQYGKQGYRVLGVCYKESNLDSVAVSDEADMTFAGFVLLEDPVKKGIENVLQELKDLHVKVKIITGDNRIVAACIGNKIGLTHPVILTGDALIKMSPEALVQRAVHIDIFAEIEPNQKERIVQALRKKFTVAYLGDGINDVAAINAADVGISVNNATDVARSAADFVLMEPDLAVLASGIWEGRKTFSNTLKYIFITTGATFGNMMSVAVASLLLPFLPMQPIQILLTNFLSDLPFLAIATDNVDVEELQKSSRWDIGLIRRYMIVFGIHSSLFDMLTFWVLLYAFKAGETVFQTGWFVESVCTELIILFIIRTKKPFFKSQPGKLLLWLGLAALFITLLLPYLQFAPHFSMQPLAPRVLISMLAIVVAYVLTADWLKVWFFRWMSGHKK